MLGKLLTGSSALTLLVAVSFVPAEVVRAEMPQPQPKLSVRQKLLPPRIAQQNSSLNQYMATDAIPTLRLGSTGQAVEDVQTFLKQAGLYDGAIDGNFGQASQVAVARFQKQARLIPDGVVGIETWRAMINLGVS